MTSQTSPAEISEEDAEGHRYEDHGKIYFYFAEGRWHLDSTSVDGYSLDGLDGLDCTFGGCPNRCKVCRTPEATAERDQAEATPLPTGREVLDMLAEWFGYTLVKTADQPTTAAEPDRLLAKFRSYQGQLDARTAEYYADPNNEQDPIATGRYADDCAELYEQAVILAFWLDSLATAGHLPQEWTPAQDGTDQPDTEAMFIGEPDPAEADHAAPMLARWFRRITSHMARIRPRR